MKREDGVGAVLTVLVVALTVWGISCEVDRRGERFRECMNEKHDKYICEPYARGGRR